jgi:MarR family transcriptional regulator, transcriptional regulator for hemolysin
MSSSKTENAPIDAPERRRLPILLRHAWYSLNQAFRRRLATTGITPDQFTALRTLLEHRSQRLTQSQLTRLIASDPNTIASLLERMEKAGWIARLPHEKDRRAYRIQLLTAGVAKYKQGRRIAVALQTEVFAQWPEQKRQSFLDDLACVSERCRAAAGSGKRKPRPAPASRAN